MSQGNKPIYGAEEIRKYHSGELSAGQRHALERAALEDPFLADALEGYAFTPTPEADLQSIRKRLSPPSKKRVFPMFMRAAVLILAISGMLFLILKEDKKPETSISTIPSSPAPPSVNPQATEQDKISNTSTESAGSHVDGYGGTTTGTLQNNTNKPSNKTIERKREETSNLVIKDAGDFTVQATTAPPVISDSIKSIQSNEDVATMGRTSRAKETSRNDTIRVDIVLPENKAALSEVVVTNLGAKPRAYAPPDPKFETLEPTQGWEIYNDYIAENLREPESRIRQKRSAANGEVELQFDTNSFGEAENIKVTGSQCKTCEKEAIRLLSKGPKWKAGLKQRKIRIRF